MSLNISDTQRVSVWTVEDHEKFALVQMSSSRKDKQSNEYKNTSWSYVRFVGAAYGKIATEGLKHGDRIILKGATIAQEPYMVDGVKTYPKYPQITVFNWEHFVPDGAPASSGIDTPPQVEEDESGIPF